VFAGEVQHYLKHYGSCTSAEYLLERESYRQNPQPLFAFLKQYAAAKPVEVRSEQSEVSAKAQEELFKTLGFLGKLRGKRLLQELIFFLRARENLDFLAQSRVDRLRRQVLQLGELLTRRGELAEARDISYLKRDELERAFSAGGGSTAVFRSLQAGISERRREQERYAALPRCSHLCCFGSLARENMTVLRESLTQEELSEESERLFLRGIPCGAVREGEASFFDGETLPRASGAVLLANHCTEKLFPLLALSRGLVLERGNLWSHEAVVARELGLLSLIRVPGLFRAVREGEWLRADGRRGILERSSEGDAERIEEVEV
jgi:phosphoenolpyruvate synthase/pyruvate phosphate dikinase